MWPTVKLCLFIALCCVPATQTFTHLMPREVRRTKSIWESKINNNNNPKKNLARIFFLSKLQTQIPKEADSD